MDGVQIDERLAKRVGTALGLEINGTVGPLPAGVEAEARGGAQRRLDRKRGR